MTSAKPAGAVAAAFEGFAPEIRVVLLDARRMILDVAKECEVGALTETLKWGEPSYLTEASKAGTTLRLGVTANRPAMFINCRTTLVESYRQDFGTALQFDGSRAVFLDGAPDENALAICIGRALTYHRDKKRRAAG